MKKPKYTRVAVGIHRPIPADKLDAACLTLNTLIQLNEYAKDSYIKELKNNKSKLKQCKKLINKRIKNAKKRLKSYTKLRSEQSIPACIFQLKCEFVDQETVELVRKSPEGMKHLESAYADYENGPFKGMFRWFAFSDPYNTSRIFIGITDPKSVKSFNKIKAYREVYNRLYDKYVSRHFIANV